MRSISILVVACVCVLFFTGSAVADIAPPPDTSCKDKKIGDECYSQQSGGYYGTCTAVGTNGVCERKSPQPDAGPRPTDDTDEGGCAVSSQVPPSSGVALLVGLLLVIRLRRNSKNK